MACHQESDQEIKPRSMVTNTGYWFNSDANTNPNLHHHQQQQQPHMVNHQLQSFETNPEMFNLSTIIGFQPNTNNIGGTSSSSKNNMSSTHEQFYQHGNFVTTTNMLVTTNDHDNQESWNDPSLRCVFPCEGNERPSQGLSLSLCSSNPSSIGLQSFELRHQQEIGLIHDGFNLGKSTNQGYFHHQVRDSKYLSPVQELLSEFCSLGIKQNNINDHSTSSKVQKPHQWQDHDQSAGTSKKMQSLQSLDLLELQKRKTKLLQMLEEVDRRYKHYCDQMKSVVSSFEEVAGNGAARVYSALASRAMSRHFRCLRDGIVAQIKSTKKAMGEKDTTSTLIPGSTRGETPRLRLLDQTLRQQKAFQQMNMMETHPWRPQRGLPERSVSVLRAWLFEHFLHPYPSDVDKHILARQTGLSRSQVSNWFINARVRLWKPMVEEMYLEETKEEEEENLGSPNGSKALHDDEMNQNIDQDHKPNLVRIDSECISSIIINPHDIKNDHHNTNKNYDQVQNYGVIRSGDHHHQSFGAIELDFSSYNSSGGGANINAYGGGGVTSNKINDIGVGVGGGVSLTLGLQQHGDGSGTMGLNNTFSSHQSSLFYPRDHDEQVQYSSLLDSENQNLPYRNLMGAQLLHDLAG